MDVLGSVKLPPKVELCVHSLSPPASRLEESPERSAKVVLETSAEEQGDSCDVNRRLRTAHEKAAIDCFDVAGRNDWHRPAI